MFETCIHVKVSDIAFNIYVCTLIYSSFSVQVLSLLSSALVKSILSYNFASLYFMQNLYKYDQTVQSNNLRLSMHLFLLSYQKNELLILCAVLVFVISVSLVSLLLHIDCSPEVKIVKYFNSWDHWKIVHPFLSSQIFVMFCDLHSEKMGEKHLQYSTGLLFYHRLVVLVCPDKGAAYH